MKPTNLFTLERLEDFNIIRLEREGDREERSVYRKIISTSAGGTFERQRTRTLVGENSVQRDQSGITLATIVRLLYPLAESKVGRGASSLELFMSSFSAGVRDESAQWTIERGRGRRRSGVDPRGRADNLLGFQPSRA